MRKRSRSWLRGNVRVFGRNVSVLLLAIALSATAAFALLTNYVSVTGNASVEQSVVIDTTDTTGGCHLTWDTESTDQCTGETISSASWTATAAGGETRDVGLRIANKGDIAAPVDVVASGTVPVDAAWNADVIVQLYSDYNPTTEDCVGETPVGTFITSGSSLSLSDLPANSEQWVCIRQTWVINAQPGAYTFDVDLNPAGP